MYDKVLNTSVFDDEITLGDVIPLYPLQTSILKVVISQNQTIVNHIIGIWKRKREGWLWNIFETSL